MACLTGAILAVNCGSSSLKFGLYNAGESGVHLLCEGEAEELGKQGSSFWFKKEEGAEKEEEKVELADHDAALQHALAKIRDNGVADPTAVGHRVVHGGLEVREHQKLTPVLFEKLKTAEEFAPLHVPPALKAIAAVEKNLPDLPQVICLDTAFHRTIADVTRAFPLPPELGEKGVQRYGFHGLSLESILPQLKPVLERLVVAHLGSGCSITAICKGESLDTTMGLTPTGGIMMGSRPGDLDPGLMVYLLRHGYETPEKLEQLFNHDSGFSGVSQKGSDLRQLEKLRAADKQVDLALRMFSYEISKSVAAMAAALSGLDLLVFTGGIGEHIAWLRDEISHKLGFLGRFETRALPSQEDLQIAVLTAALA